MIPNATTANSGQIKSLHQRVMANFKVKFKGLYFNATSIKIFQSHILLPFADNAYCNYTYDLNNYAFYWIYYAVNN